MLCFGQGWMWYWRRDAALSCRKTLLLVWVVVIYLITVGKGVMFVKSWEALQKQKVEVKGLQLWWEQYWLPSAQYQQLFKEIHRQRLAFTWRFRLYKCYRISVNCVASQAILRGIINKMRNCTGSTYCLLQTRRSFKTAGIALSRLLIQTCYLPVCFSLSL